MNQDDFAPLLALPYVRMLGFEARREAEGLRGYLPFAEHLIGNPLVPALHGGVVGALLHLTASTQLMAEAGSGKVPRVFTCTIEYLASPELRDCVASAEIVSRSRRFANVRATAWQPHSGKAIGAGTLQFLVG